jgi:hypothetical protein
MHPRPASRPSDLAAPAARRARRLRQFAFLAPCAFLVCGGGLATVTVAWAQPSTSPRSPAAPAPAPMPPPLPRPSPNATVSQSIGITEVTVHYSRPGVKGRPIWGKLVPYGEVWRTGANENTTIRFSTSVRIDGKELPAGLYGLQTIPGADDWTIILSRDADQWGAFSYKPDHDALRFHAKPAAAGAAQEWMTFDFADLSDSSAVLELRWERLVVPFKIEVDTAKAVVAAAAHADQRWRDVAAGWCIQTGNCLAEAGQWLDASIAAAPGFGNQRAKARLLARQGSYSAAVATGERALTAGRAAKQPPPPEQLADFEKEIAGWKGR